MLAQVILDSLLVTFILASVALGVCVIAALMLSGRISRREEADELRRHRGWPL